MPASDTFSILIVDDDRTVIRVLTHILGEFAPLRFATTGPTALKLARDSAPDLILLDVEMPEQNGFEICEAFKSDTALREVPIIFITSHDSPQLQAKGLELGAVDFISKPPHAPLVLSRVRTYQRLKSLTETVRSIERLDTLTDSLTRRQFEQALAQEWRVAQRNAASLVLLLVAIDGFADYNARFGDSRGDACLHDIANALRSAVRRPEHLIGRHAGGRFSILLPDTDGHGAANVARRALEAADALGMTLSIGAAQHQAGGNADPGADALVSCAELALQHARSAGGREFRLLTLADAPGAASAQR